MIQTALQIGLSNHRPIKLNSEGVNWGPRPFKFENCWLFQKEFLPLVRNWWGQAGVHGFTGFRIVKKLQILKNNIKEWNQEVFDRIEVRRESVMMKLEEWDLVEEERDLTEVERATRETTVKELWKLHRIEEVSWR